MASVSDRLRQLEEIEKDVVKAVRVAGQCLQELSRDPTSQLVTDYTSTFLTTLQSVDQRLSEQITYLSQVSTSQWHGDSVYLAEREFQLTCQRTDLVRQELRKLYGIITGDRDISDPLEAVEPMDTAEGPIV